MCRIGWKKILILLLVLRLKSCFLLLSALCAYVESCLERGPLQLIWIMHLIWVITDTYCSLLCSWFDINVKSKLFHLYHCNRPRSIYCVSVLSVSPHFKCLHWIQIRLRDPNDGADMANFHAYSLLYEKKIPWGKLKALSSKQSANNFYVENEMDYFCWQSTFA